MQRCAIADKTMQKAVVKTKTLRFQFVLIALVSLALERVHILVDAVHCPTPAASQLLTKSSKQCPIWDFNKSLLICDNKMQLVQNIQQNGQVRMGIMYMYIHMYMLKWSVCIDFRYCSP